MILEKIDEYLSKKEKKIIKEDIDSLDITDDIIKLIDSLDDSLLNDEQIKLKNKILLSLDISINDEIPPEPVLDDNFIENYIDNLQDPETEEPFEIPDDKYYEDKTEWVKKLSEGKKKPVTKKKNSVKKPEKDINKNKKKN